MLAGRRFIKMVCMTYMDFFQLDFMFDLFAGLSYVLYEFVSEYFFIRIFYLRVNKCLLTQVIEC